MTTYLVFGLKSDPIKHGVFYADELLGTTNQEPGEQLDESDFAVGSLEMQIATVQCAPNLFRGGTLTMDCMVRTMNLTCTEALDMPHGIVAFYNFHEHGKAHE